MQKMQEENNTINFEFLKKAEKNILSMAAILQPMVKKPATLCEDHSCIPNFT